VDVPEFETLALDNIVSTTANCSVVKVIPRDSIKRTAAPILSGAAISLSHQF